MTGNERVTDPMLDAYKLAFDGYMHDWLNGNFEPPSKDVGRHATKFALEAALSAALPPRDGVTDAMVEAGARLLLGRVNAPEQEVYKAARECLEAALAPVPADEDAARAGAVPVAGEAVASSKARLFIYNYLIERDESCGFISDEDERKESAREIFEGAFARASPVPAAVERGTDLRDFAAWVDTWVSQPVTAFSVMALDGLFAQARERLDRLSKQEA